MANGLSDVDLATGTAVGERYEILAPISSGAMGAVFRAMDDKAKRQVALKRLTDTRHAARFEIEARLLSALSHPRVVEVMDYFQDDTGQYIVMDLVEGIDLSRLLKAQGNPGLPLRDAIKYVCHACEALHYVHEQHIVHRDVKPQNLILGEEGIVLVDFGVAREMGEDEQGTVGIGTPRFMAPEIFAGGSVSPRSDVFSLAATLWTLLAGKPPVYADPTRLSDLHPEVSPEFEHTVAAGLEMIPERRVASVTAFAKAIGTPLETRPGGESLALSIERSDAPRNLMEGIVRAAAGVFEAAASSIALTDLTTGELVFQSAWGAGAREIVGVRLPPGQGISGRVAETGEAAAVSDCRSDPRFAAQIAAGTGYVPHTMLVVPLKRGHSTVGTLSLLDRRDGGTYGPADMDRAALFADLAIRTIDVEPLAFTSLGETQLGGS